MSLHRNIFLLNNQQYATVMVNEMELRSILSPIAAGGSSCLTYTVAVYAVLSS
jgi:hypothetical protein